jgi:hypothetical protein
MEELGRITRLQVQTDPLKRGEQPHRWYDADRILRVGALTVTPAGVVGHLDGGDVVDVHHRDHPRSRHRGDNGISLCPTGHYATMRGEFGDHLTNGVAGENVLLDRGGWLSLGDLGDGVTVVTGDGEELVLATPRPAQPCVEFSRHVVGDATSVREPLRRLMDGMRGYLFTVASGAGTVLREGDRVLRRVP